MVMNTHIPFSLIPTSLRWSTLSSLREKSEKIKKPSLWLAIERVVERSKDRVSQLCDHPLLRLNEII